MLIKQISDINPKSSNKNHSFINYIDTSSVHDGNLLNVTFLDHGYPSRAQRELKIDDILISSVRPNLKHNYFVKSELPNLIGSTGFIQIRLNNRNYSSKYIYYFLTSQKRVDYYSSIANFSQTTFPSFNKDVIENLEIPNISLNEQLHIVNTILFYFFF